MKDIEAAVEGILFASGEPVEYRSHLRGAEHGPPHGGAGTAALWTITAMSDGACGCFGWRTAGSCAPAPEYGDVIRKAFEIRKPAKLSQPALEVLTIIAYYQPTTRAYVDQVRGVDSSYTMGLLLDRQLIEECGRLQVPGRPRLYRTTQAVFAGVSSEFAGGAAPAAGNGGRRTAAAGRRYGTGGRGERRGGAVSIRER